MADTDDELYTPYSDDEVTDDLDLAEFTFKNNAAQEVAAVDEKVLQHIDELAKHGARSALTVMALLGDADAYLAGQMADVAADLNAISLTVRKHPERLVLAFLATMGDTEKRARVIAAIRGGLDAIETGRPPDEVIQKEVLDLREPEPAAPATKPPTHVDRLTRINAMIEARRSK